MVMPRSESREDWGPCASGATSEARYAARAPPGWPRFEARQSFVHARLVFVEHERRLCLARTVALPLEMGLWKVGAGALSGVTTTKLQNESELEMWLEADHGLLGMNLLLVGSQVPTDHNGRIDLLALDESGALQLIELKRDKTPREVVAQALDYASWVADLTRERLREMYRLKRNGADLDSDFRSRFGTELPEPDGQHGVTIVASALDASSERIVQYLSGFGLNINAIFFRVFQDGETRFVGRTWLIDPATVVDRVDARASGSPVGAFTGFYSVNVGEGAASRSWEDNQQYGFVSAGQGLRYRRAMERLQVGDRIFVYISGRLGGYVGYGIVRAPAVKAIDFRTDDGTPLLDKPVTGTVLRQNVHDDDLAEYVVGVDWQKTFPRTQPKSYPGIFKNQNAVCKISDIATANFLKSQFGVE